MFRTHVDTTSVHGLTAELRAAAVTGMQRSGERGVEIMRQEAPKDEGRLEHGITHLVDQNGMRVQIVAQAVRPAQPARDVTLSLGNGRTRTIKFNAQPAYDYARAVAEGTGLYGARGQEIKPKSGRKRLRFVVAGGTVFAGSVKGMRPNPYDVRTAERLEREVVAIFEAAMGSLLNP